MKITRILILTIAAGAGYLYYNRFHAVMNITDNSSLPVDANGQVVYSPGRSGIAKTGSGLGTVGTGKQIFGGNNADSAPSTTRYEGDVAGLLQAAIKGDKAKVKKLLEGEVKVDGRDAQRRSALMYASWNGHNDICAMLLAAGANPLFQDRDGHNAYDYAAASGLDDTLKLLLSQTQSKDDRHYREYATLIRSALAGDAAQLPAGKKKIASINRITPDGKSPLHIAASNGSALLMEELIHRGANVNLQSDIRQTPLHWAAWNNQVTTLGILLDNHADIAQRDLGGNTALMLAAQNNSVGAVKLLLAKGANKKAANKQKKTARMLAEDKGFAELATLLQ